MDTNSDLKFKSTLLILFYVKKIETRGFFKKWRTKNTTLQEQFQNPMPKSQREAKSIPLTYKYKSVPWLGTGTLIRSGGVQLESRVQTSPLCEMMPSYNYLPCVNKIPSFTYNRANSVISISLACFRILSCSNKFCVYCSIIPVYHE